MSDKPRDAGGWARDFHGETHVIEYSAYESVIEENKSLERLLDQAIKERDQWRASSENWQRSFSDFKTELELCIKERDDLIKAGDVAAQMVKEAMDEARAELKIAKQSIVFHIDAERAKSQKLLEAIAQYEQAFDDTGNDFSHLVCLQKARALAEYSAATPTESKHYCAHQTVSRTCDGNKANDRCLICGELVYPRQVDKK